MGFENVSVINCFSGLEDLDGCKKFLLKRTWFNRLAFADISD